jgi:hypothetical protein
LVYIKKKDVRMTMELEVPKRHVCVAYIIHFNGPMGFGVRGKRGSLAANVKGPW